MESRRGLRSRASMPIPPQTHQNHGLSEPESSDEDDNGIPASRLPSISPAKRHSPPTTHHLAKRVKRTSGNTVRDGIILYPRPRRPTNGFHMTSSVRRSPSDNGPMPPLLVSFPAVPYAGSSSLSPEDEVLEGLIPELNSAFRQPREHSSYDNPAQRRRSPRLSHEDNNKGEHGIETHSRNNELPTVSLSRSISPTLPLDFEPRDSEDNDVAEAEETTRNGAIQNKVQEPGADTAVPRIEENAASRREIRAQTETTILAPFENKTANGVCAAERSHEQLIEDSGARFVGGQPPPDTKGRRAVSTPSSLLSIPQGLATRSPTGAKRRVGRPKKIRPHLCGKTNQEDPPTLSISLLYRDEDGVFEEDPGTLSSVPQLQARDFSLVTTGVVSSNQDYPTAIESLGARSKDELEENRAARETYVGCENIDSGIGRQGSDPTHTGESPRSHADECGQYIPDAADFDNDDEVSSQFTAGSQTDEDDQGENEPPRDDFMRDVHYFNSRDPTGPESDDAFASPSEDDVVAVHVDPGPLGRVCRLLIDESWAGVGSWAFRYVACEKTETKPARALLRVLAQLERLYQTAPKAPYLKEQNAFLKKHANMLSYYFHRIKGVLHHIRTRRLESLERNNTAQDADPRKRKRITRDILLYVMPMMSHILASVWDLGGKEGSLTAFTCSTVGLLERGLNWMMTLRRRLLREVQQLPLAGEGNIEYEKIWPVWDIKREAIDQALEDLRQVVGAAPARLNEAEARVERELRREQPAEQEVNPKSREQPGATEKTRLEKRKKRPSSSTHGGRYLAPSGGSFRRSSPLAHRPTEWSLEEKTLLFKHIQESFPEPPNIHHLRLELNKTHAETTAVAEDILEKMLAAVKPNQPARERAAEARRIIRGS
ncbi:hypothetical protein GGS20DRAFT_558100 [Poronia punctata]|nr:hypothetical protein GGS20DRAFT_558100 [Poronia punctata]